MAFDALAAVHLLAAGAALATGSAVAVAPKGTARHRALGQAYLGAMVALNVSALLIYDLTGRPNLFHVFAVVSLLTVLAGFAAARRRGPSWRPAHARWMLWSYVGLWCATTSELAVRLPAVRTWTHFGLAVGAATVATAAAGAWLIHRAVARVR